VNSKEFNQRIAGLVLGKRITGIYFFNDLDHAFALLFDDGTALDISVTTVNEPYGGSPAIAYGLANTMSEMYGKPLDEWDPADEGIYYRLETSDTAEKA
jgi:hypothetical protein